MPRYDYKCKNCLKEFFIVCSITDPRKDIKCELCGSHNTLRIYNAKIIKRRSEEKISEISSNKVKHNHSNHTEHDHEYGQHCSPENDYI